MKGPFGAFRVALGGDDDDLRFGGDGPETADAVKAEGVGQIDVQKHHVRHLLFGQGQPLGQTFRGHPLMPQPFEKNLHLGLKDGIIVHNEYAGHAAPFRKSGSVHSE